MHHPLDEAVDREGPWVGYELLMPLARLYWSAAGLLRVTQEGLLQLIVSCEASKAGHSDELKGGLVWS